MLLICPECRTRYVVPDGAIGAAGRQVRCANCRHSWFQQGTATPPAPPAPAFVAPPEAAPQPAESEPAGSAPSEVVDDTAGSVAVEPDAPLVRPGFSALDRPEPDAAPAETPIPPSFDRPAFQDVPPAPVYVAPPEPEIVRSQFAHEPPFRPRRNPARLMTYAAVAFAIVIAALAAATWHYGWLENSFAASGQEPDLKIELHDNLELGRDADGSPYFIASGSIVNPTSRPQRVPELLVTLKDASGRSVYSWTMKAPVRTLAPGGKVDFSQLRRDVPLAASRISVGWAIDG
ncbi:MAG: zinc-ribbon domain-containing protein [Sphingomonadales bacterium]|nr:zinc-ribbon domain-containing protein [Sphingomonadales bacterium]